MSTTTRAIIVGNNDSSIEYSLSPESRAGNLTAPTLFPNLHEIHSNGTLRFEFSGTQISLFGGTQEIESIWTCFVDNIPSTQSTINNGEFCHTPDLVDEEHVLTLNATRGGQPFWVDYISYTPSQSVSLDNSLIRVSNTDPDISFSTSGWEPGDGYNITNTTGSWMSFDFIGQSLKWYGDINHTDTIPIASYVVDGEPPLTIPTPGSVPSDSQNQLFFEINNLSSDGHSLRVTFNGNQSSTPLTLAFMLVQNGTNVDPIYSPTSTSASMMPTPTPSSLTTASNSHAKVNIGAIVGGSLGAIILLLLLVFLFIRHRKQTRKTRTVTIRPSFSESLTDKAVPLVHHDIKSQQLYKPVNASHDEIDENSPHYGGYQTWGQIKAIEAGSKTNIRDSYM